MVTIEQSFEQFLSTDAAKLVIPAFATIAAAIIGAALVWAKEMTATARRVRLLDEAAKRVEFWKSWSNALEEVRAPYLDAETKMKVEINDRLRAEVEMRKVSDSLRDVYFLTDSDIKWTASSFKRYRSRIGWLRRLLLLYRQPNRTARMYRRMAYVLPLFAFFELWLLDHMLHRLPHRATHLRYALISLVIVIGFLLFRQKAIRLEMSQFRDKLNSYSSE